MNSSLHPKRFTIMALIAASMYVIGASSNTKYENPLISVVYYAFISPVYVHWRYLVSEQLSELRPIVTSKYLTDVHAVFASENVSLLSEAASVAKFKLPTVNIHEIHENLFEYPGIHLVWELANKNRSRDVDYFLYFHSKGMVNSNFNSHKIMRTGYNVALTAAVILQWELVLHLFSTRSDVKKVGYISSCKGFVWFNFFWVRGSYIIGLVEPQKPTNKHPNLEGRFYYEHWLGKLLNKEKTPADRQWNDTISLAPTFDMNHTLTSCNFMKLLNDPNIRRHIFKVV